MRNNPLRWFNHIQHRLLSAPVRKCEDFNLNQPRGRGRTKLRGHSLLIKKDMKDSDLCDDLALNNIGWWKIIHVANPK